RARIEPVDRAAAMIDAANRQERRRQQKLSKAPAATPPAERGLAAAIEHHRAGRLAQAEAMYRRVLERRSDHTAASWLLEALRPGFAWARHNLGGMLGQLGEHEEAVACFRHIAAAMPDSAEAHNDLGNALSELGKGREAIASYRRVVALKPAFAEAHYNLGSA